MVSLAGEGAGRHGETHWQGVYCDQLLKPVYLMHHTQLELFPM